MGDGGAIGAERRDPDMRTVPGRHGPIVDMGTWDGVRAGFARFEPRTDIGRPLENPLASIVRRAGCGKMMARRAYTHGGVPVPIIVCRSDRCIAGQGSLETVGNMAVAELEEELGGQQAIPAGHGDERHGDGRAPGLPKAGIAGKGRMVERVDGLHGLGDCGRTGYLGRPRGPRARKAESMERLGEAERRIGGRDGGRGNAVPVPAEVSDGYRTSDVEGGNGLSEMVIETVTCRRHESGGDIGPGPCFRLSIQSACRHRVSGLPDTRCLQTAIMADSRMATRLSCAQLTRFHMKTARYGGILLWGFPPPANTVCTFPP